MSDSEEGSIFEQSDVSDGERPLVNLKRTSLDLKVQAQLEALLDKPCRCAGNICFTQFSRCPEAVAAERARFRALPYTDQVGYIFEKK